MKNLRRIVRWMVAGVCAPAGAWLLCCNLPKAGPTDALPPPPIPYGPVLSGILLMAFALLAIVPDAAAPIAGLIGDCWAALFFPEARFKKPALSYTLADFYCEQERHAEAIIEYRKIIRHYPGERRAYLGLISLCRLTGDTRLAEKHERLFRKRFGP